MNSALLKLLQSDVDVSDVRIERGRLFVRMRRHATADAWPRIDALVGHFGRPNSQGRTRAA